MTPSKPPEPVIAAVEVLGLEVGDYGREHIWVLTGDDLWRVKLEGWGQECVPGKGCRAARSEARKLAESWREYEDSTGWFPVEDRRVWAMTWALTGPYDPAGVSEIDSSDLIEV